MTGKALDDELRARFDPELEAIAESSWRRRFRDDGDCCVGTNGRHGVRGWDLFNAAQKTKLLGQCLCGAKGVAPFVGGNVALLRNGTVFGRCFMTQDPLHITGDRMKVIWEVAMERATPEHQKVYIRRALELNCDVRHTLYISQWKWLAVHGQFIFGDRCLCVTIEKQISYELAFVFVKLSFDLPTLNFLFV